MLSDLSFVVEKGQTAAFVGSSGSGKSTIVALLERFYNPDAGQARHTTHLMDVMRAQILVDDVDLASVDVDHYRSSVVLVSQEPKLFNLSIAENIAYGLTDPAPSKARPPIGIHHSHTTHTPLIHHSHTTHTPQDAIAAAAANANAATFIGEFPQRFETSVGEWGNQLSGGQACQHTPHHT